MTQEIEIEYKNLLTEAEYKRLLTGLPFPEEAQVQVNHYFETGDFALKKLGCALRIREKNGRFISTLKEPHPRGLLETHDTLTHQEAAHWMNGNVTLKENISKRFTCKTISEENLVYYGSLTTNRRELTCRDVLMVLDYSTYHGNDDYELEIEAQSETAGLEAMKQLMKKFSINKRKTPNKIQRFFNAAQANKRHHKSD